MPSQLSEPARAPTATRISACRGCGGTGLQVFLSLGELPLPDGLLREDELGRPEPRFPLDVAFCPSCSLVQILDEVPPATLFVENYLYFSSYSEDLLAHAREEALALIREQALGTGSLVVEIASNDGYLLRNFVERGIPVLGIDPAPAQAAAATRAGIPTIGRFFGLELAHELIAERGHADAVIANNVLAHTPDPNDLMAGMAALVADDGVVAVENTYVRDLVDGCAFDTIYHEHFSYYSCSSIAALARRHGLFLSRVEHFPSVQGGSLRWYFRRHDEPEPSALELLRAEREDGVLDLSYYASFAARVERLRTELLALLRRLRDEGKTIDAYGAAAKGTVLLNYAGIDDRLVDFVVDRNPYKVGLRMPGVHLPILPPAALLERRPDYLLLLAWNWVDEIVRQQDEYRRRGGRFVVPVPEPKIL